MSNVMKKFRASLTLGRLAPVATLAIAAGLFFAGPAHSQTAMTPALNIAIANPAKIADEMLETKDLQAKWDVDTKGLQDQATAKKNHLAVTEQSLTYLKPDTQAYADKENEALQESIELDAWVKETQLSLARRQKI